jgi:hypothetical protein
MKIEFIETGHVGCGTRKMKNCFLFFGICVVSGFKIKKKLPQCELKEH